MSSKPTLTSLSEPSQTPTNQDSSSLIHQSTYVLSDGSIVIYDESTATIITSTPNSITVMNIECLYPSLMKTTNLTSDEFKYTKD
jgi:hypothetical protein